MQAHKIVICGLLLAHLQSANGSVSMLQLSRMNEAAAHISHATLATEDSTSCLEMGGTSGYVMNEVQEAEESCANESCLVWTAIQATYWA